MLVPDRAAAVAAAPFGIGGRTGVETLRDAESFSRELLARNEFTEELLGESTLSLRPCVTTATIGRRGRLPRSVRLRESG